MGRPSSAGSVLRLVTRRISHPFPGLSPLGSRPRYCCLPHSPSEVLGLGLLATNLKPTLTSPFAGSLRNLQSFVQRRTTANRGLTLCNAQHTMQRMHWCRQNFTLAMHWAPCSSYHTILRLGTIDHTERKVQSGQDVAQTPLY